MFIVEAGLIAVEAITGSPPSEEDIAAKKASGKASILHFAAQAGAVAVKGGDVPYGW